MTVGTRLKSSFESWPNVPPYIVKTITGPCKCPSYIDHINRSRRNANGEWYTVEPKPSKPHYHLVVKSPWGGDGYLNGFAPSGPRWESVWGMGYLWAVDEEGKAIVPEQQSLFGCDQWSKR